MNKIGFIGMRSARCDRAARVKAFAHRSWFSPEHTLAA
ncbi:hypothetical protein LMG26411_03714 [Cupriavidus numazuensis]|uniref:Uncharacterized protein n=1 Tax=Cupriavidus numazuensis TaxID=221992 RepID=A0ABM8TK06_9BURK|nr:hypothetical protein LMG26411_03714 [Cupriavidus numazuensis]